MKTLTLEDEIVILNKYRITPNELMFIMTLLTLQEDENEELFASYLEILHNSNVQIRAVIESLQDKGVILKSYKLNKQGEGFDPYEIPLAKNFTKQLYRSSYELGKELFEAYPQFGLISGTYVPLRTVAKKFDSLEDCFTRYGKEIRWNPKLHNHIIELVKWADENKILNQSIASFIINHTWNDLDALRNGTDQANINFDSVKLI